MADEGILEKITVTKKKSGGVQSRTQALRLRRPDELQVDGENVNVDVKVRQHALREVAQEEDDDDGSSYPVTMRTIEQQVLDLVMNAGSRGITNVVSTARSLRCDNSVRPLADLQIGASRKSPPPSATFRCASSSPSCNVSVASASPPISETTRSSRCKKRSVA